jgi:hypothetical protein
MTSPRLPYEPCHGVRHGSGHVLAVDPRDAVPPGEPHGRRPRALLHLTHLHGGGAGDGEPEALTSTRDAELWGERKVVG